MFWRESFRILLLSSMYPPDLGFFPSMVVHSWILSWGMLGGFAALLFERRSGVTTCKRRPSCVELRLVGGL